ncbi:MAG: BatA domain-containing protein [Fuerstiella sp.]
MNFLNFMNQPLAWGALAFSIPLILHILNRSRFRRVEWGAMHLLESVVKVNHKRFRLEQLLLLLVRCAIPALLAFALARPVLTATQTPTGDTPVSLVILLDTSYSMDATKEGISHFDKAIDAACAVVEATPRGSEIAVIQTGGVPTPLFDQPIFDSKAIVRRLRTLRADFGASDMQQSLDTGIATLAGMTHVRRELMVISDFQPADWQGSSAADSIQQQVAAMSIKPELTLLQMGQVVTGNVSVESLDFSNRPLGIGQQLSVRANLRNHGNTASENARVVFKIDGKEEAVAQVALAANAATQTLFPCELTTPGSHVLEVEVVVDDPLKKDNRFSAAVTIWDQIDVLLVDGDQSSQPLKSETDFLAVALTPYTFGRMKLSDLVKTKTVNYKTNLKKEFEAQPKVVVLANVPKLTDAQCNELRDYVQAGGAVFICAGGKIDSKWYNKELFAKRGLLPAEFGMPKGKIDEKGLSSRIVAQHFDHPALQFFNEPSNGDLSTAEIRQWYELIPPESRSMILTSISADEQPPAASSSDAIVMARLDSGDPLLVEKKLGEGIVVQMATACDADWSDLPMRPVYVPLMQQIVTTLATQLTPPRNIQTGQAAVALFSDGTVTDTAQPTSSASVTNAKDSISLSMTTPTGARRTVRAFRQGNRLMARYDGTRRPGVYGMSTPEGQTVHFVASTSRDESDLSMLDEAQLNSLADNMGAHVVDSPTQYLEQDRLRRNGREIWRYLLAALLAFMFLELILQQRFSRVRT